MEPQPRKVQHKGAHGDYHHGQRWLLHSLHRIREWFRQSSFRQTLSILNLTPICQVIFVQYLPIYFNQSWAGNIGYQGESSVAIELASVPHRGNLVLVTLSTNFIGYGLAGLTRRFLVYPSFAVWPSNLATIALNVSNNITSCPRRPLIL